MQALEHQMASSHLQLGSYSQALPSEYGLEGENENCISSDECESGEDINDNVEIGNAIDARNRDILERSNEPPVNQLEGHEKTCKSSHRPYIIMLLILICKYVRIKKLLMTFAY